MALIKQYMSTPVSTIDERTRLGDVDRRLSEDMISGLLVTNDRGVPTGMISRTDLIRAGGGHVASGQRTLSFPEAASVRSAMSSDPVSIGLEEPVAHAARLMRRRRVHRLLVVEGSEPVGLFSTTDALRALRDARAVDPLEQFASKAIASIVPEVSVAAASRQLREAGPHALVVMDNGEPVGLFGQEQALSAQNSEPRTPVDQWMNPAVLCLPANTPVHRAAEQCLDQHTELIVAMRDERPLGVVTSMDLIEALL